MTIGAVAHLRRRARARRRHWLASHGPHFACLLRRPHSIHLAFYAQGRRVAARIWEHLTTNVTDLFYLVPLEHCLINMPMRLLRCDV